MRRPFILALIWALLLSVVAPIIVSLFAAATRMQTIYEFGWFPSEVIAAIYIRILSQFRPIGPYEFDTIPRPQGILGIMIIYFVVFFFFFRWRARRVANAFN
jgi:hypothetical protein